LGVIHRIFYKKTTLIGLVFQVQMKAFYEATGVGYISVLYVLIGQSSLNTTRKIQTAAEVVFVSGNLIY